MQRAIKPEEKRRTDIHFVDCVERALDEELGLPENEIQDSKIVITALARSALPEDMHTHILAFVKLPNFTYQQVDNNRRSAKSGGEHLDIDAVPFDLDKLAEILLHGNRYIPSRPGAASHFFQPSSRMRILFSCFYYFGMDKTLNALWRAKEVS